ncbi:hypothetical protein ERJ70_16025 [Sediminibacillus dalangtanensis]|uniref:YcxB-like C-terminal domain-containing protein n=1 Tax=Sediminibacillus dalangtanensis TaxID=2729421 RepID=A0ABX7W0X0_9BACI|nr:YcxB family protein [Sediminibacillus dalangtanensis]QTN00663.1 hypothetical protein ERJ70_16025 [Sediminibacillus dalangtanensis]
MVEVRYRLTLEDVMALQKNTLANTKLHTSRKKYAGIITSICIFVFMLLSLGRAPLTSELLLTVVLTLSYFLVFSPVYDKLTLLSIKRMYRKTKRHPMLGAYRVVISDNGLERSTDNFHDHYQWSDFEKITEDDHHFFLYLSDVFAIIIKKESDNLSLDEEKNYHHYIKERMRMVNGG